MDLGWITKIDVKPVNSDSDRAPLARGSLEIADCMYIRFTVWPTQDGGFNISFPQSPNPKFDASQDISKTNPKNYSEVGFTSAESAKIALPVISAKVQEVLGGGSAKSTSSAKVSTIPW